MADELDEILSGSDPDPAGEAESSEPQASGPETQEPAETIDTAPPAEKVSEVAETVPVAALLDERRKRQELERQIETLKATHEAPKAPDLFEDPEGAMAHITSQFEERLLLDRINSSRETMLMVKPDYEELEAEFLKEASEDVTLVQKMQQAASPAKFAYEHALRQRDYAAVKDVDAYKARVREEILAELKAKDPRPSVDHVNLAATPGTSGSAVPTDESLSALLDGR